MSIGGSQYKWKRAFSQNGVSGVPLWLYPQNNGLQYDDVNVYHGTAYGLSGKFLITVSTDTQHVVHC